MVVHIGMLQKKLQKQNGHQKYEIDDYSLNFEVRSPKFCMVVHIHLLQKNQNQNDHQKLNGCQNTKLIKTHSIFELGAPDYAW